MIRIYVCLCLLIGLAACKEAPETYQGTYPKETFVNVVADLYFAQAAIRDISPTIKDSLIDHYKEQIEAIHKIDLAVVEADLAALQLQPKLYKAIHDQVADSIVAIETRLNKKAPINIKKQRQNKPEE